MIRRIRPILMLASLGAGAVVVSPEGVLGLKPSQALWRRGGRHSGDEQQNHLFENYAFKLQIILMWIARIYKMILHDVLLPFSAVVLAGGRPVELSLHHVAGHRGVLPLPVLPSASIVLLRKANSASSPIIECFAEYIVEGFKP